MIRKIIIVVLTLGAIMAAAVEAFGTARRCPWAESIGMCGNCPARLYLGKSERGLDRFVYAVSRSWFTSVGYWRLRKSHSWSGWAEDDPEAEFDLHLRCDSLLVAFGGLIPRVVRIASSPPHYDTFVHAVVFPRGFTFFALAAYPTIAFIRGPLRRYRRRKRGLCVMCGYDLRGSPGRCPECGSERHKQELLHAREK